MTSNNQLIAIKRTSVTHHRGNNRAWLEPCKEMIQAGFTAKARYDIDYNEDSVVLRLNPEGKRGVSNTARGPILDLCNRKMNKYNLEGGIQWIIADSVITIVGVE